ncbi:hypothetical protein BH10BAC5_BH10BAC5_07040 [soil metagenome]
MIKNIFFTFCLIFSTITGVYAQSFQWQAIPNAPFDNSRHEDMMFLNSKTGWVVNYAGPVYKTTNGGVRFDTLYRNLNLYCRSVGFLDANTGIVGTLDPSHSLYRTTNGGANFSLVTNVPAPVPTGICGITQLPPNIFYAVGKYGGPAFAIKSTDKGATWINLHIDTSQATRLVDTYFNDSLHGFIIGNKGGANYEQGKAIILYTSDGGVTWVNKYMGTTIGYLSWKIDFRGDSFGYVSCENFNGNPPGYLFTTDGGMNWSFHTIPNAPTLNLEGIGFLNPSTGWVGGWTPDFQAGPTFQTTNGGVNWFQVTFGKALNRFQFFGDTLAYVCGQTIYKYSLITAIHQISSAIPDNFKLEQNYPNPFNPSTKIKFSVSHTSFIELNVYDNTGKEITVLHSGTLQSGEYETTFNGESFSTGIYFVRLSAENFVETKRIMLIK